MSPYPPIQIVNDHDEPIGEASLDEIHTKGLIHRVVVIFVEDTEGRLLLQKRGPNVATYPNRWDISSAGHVDRGENYLSAAYREMAEELGLRGFDLTAVDNVRWSNKIGKLIVDRFIGIYKTVVPVGTPITIQASEVAAVQWLSLADIRRLIHDHPDEVHDELRNFLDRYYPNAPA